MKTATRKLASQLQPGDVIAPPAHERKWMWADGVRRMLTVIEVNEGRVDKGGLWLSVKASCPFDRFFVSVYCFRPTTSVQM